MTTRRFALQVTLVAWLALPAFGEVSYASSQRNDRAPLGSPDYYPSSRRPVGWRGDGSGTYTVTDPPVKWSRRVKTPMRDFRCSARKPQGTRKTGAAVVDYGGKFKITEWLALGPLDPPDASKPLDGDPVGGEAALSPDEGERSGGLEWKRVDEVGGVNFEKVFGKPKRKVGYAVSYFWSDEACICAMAWGGRDLRMWLNGAPANGWDRARHQIRKGWNRLLVKSVSPANNDTWRFGHHFFPHAGEGIEYEEENIRWTSRLPGKGWATPVIVGDRLFVTSEPNDLVCVDKNTGKILWMHSNPVWYAALEKEKLSPPRLGYIRITRRTLTLASNKSLDPKRAASPRSYTVPGARIADVAVSPDGHTVRLTASRDWPWKYGEKVSLTFPGLRSAEGESVESALVFSPVAGRPLSKDLLSEWQIGAVHENINPNEVVKKALVDEAKVDPAGGNGWKLVKEKSGVFDLTRIVGNTSNIAAHAVTYIQADAAKRVQLWLGSDDSIRAAVNGEVVHVNAIGRGCSPDQDKVEGVRLRKGWNKLVLMIGQGGGGWGFCARIMDASGRKAPEGLSFCAEVSDKTGLDAPPETGPVENELGGFGYLDEMRDRVAQLSRLNKAFVASPDWKANEERRRIAKSLTDDVRRSDRSFRVPIGWGGGNCASTPTSDGEHVYAWFGDTGVMTCYGLDGERKWTRFERPKGGEHGINASPVLVGDKVVVIAGPRWAAFDKKTGRVLWRQKYRHPCYGTAIVTTIGGEHVLIAPDGQVVRAADGVVVSKSVGRFDGECASAVLEGNRFFLYARAGFCVAELPAEATENAGVRVVRTIDPKGIDPKREPYPVGSPVVHEGVLYTARSGWGAGGRDAVLYLLSASSDRPLSTQVLEMAPEIYYGPEGGGISASLALAAGNIYAIDNRGTAIVFEASRTYRQVATNVLEHWTANGGREVIGSSPVFEGRHMYLRGFELLYCVGK